MMTAPADGSIIEVRHGSGQKIVLAYWSNQMKGWIRDDDEGKWRVLHDVTGWRSVG
jgi:hypothetical protein